MQKAEMNDMIVVLPGIMGSVLEKKGRVVWDASVAAFWAAATSFGGSIQDLRLQRHDHPGEAAPDGVVATRIVEDLTVVPYFWKIDGYTRLMEALEDTFELNEVGLDDDQAGNLVRFPYDWRRDVRVTSVRLARLVERKLVLWRKEGGPEDARVILVAHSMGGLVAKYALECLGLWRRARALITFGTPYRGAPRALDYLVNGASLERLGVRWLDVPPSSAHSPSAYQLMPRYPVIGTSDGEKRVAEGWGRSPRSRSI